MNIFRLDDDPIKAAEYACNKHVVKMCCETTQLLHTAIRHYLDSDEEVPDWLYKPFNPKHPSCLYTRHCRKTFNWVALHGLALCEQYKKRYNKTHKCEYKINLALSMAHILPDIRFINDDIYGFTAVPSNIFNSSDYRLNGGHVTNEYLNIPTYKDKPYSLGVHIYRLYYAAAKYPFAKWEPLAETPDWWEHYRFHITSKNLEIANTKNDGIVI